MVYGKPIDPQDYSALSENGRIQKKSLVLLAEAWLKEINEAYKLASLFANRQMREYPIHTKYSDATGLHHNELKDPNIIIKYLAEIKSLKSLSDKEKIDDIYELGAMLGLPQDSIREIDEVRQTYKRSLVRR